MSNCLNERCRLILSGFPELKIRQRDPRKKLFAKPAPRGWKPETGDRVYLRPGVSVGAWRVDKATVYRVAGETVTVRVLAAGARYKVAEISVSDLRPVPA